MNWNGVEWQRKNCPRSRGCGFGSIYVTKEIGGPGAKGFGILQRVLLDTSNVGRCPVKTGGSWQNETSESGGQMASKWWTGQMTCTKLKGQSTQQWFDCSFSRLFCGCRSWLTVPQPFPPHANKPLHVCAHPVLPRFGMLLDQVSTMQSQTGPNITQFARGSSLCLSRPSLQLKWWLGHSHTAL